MVSLGRVGSLLLSLSQIISHNINEYIRCHTMQVLILYLIAFKCVNYFGVIYYGQPSFVVADFPATYHSWGWTVIYMIVCGVFPLRASHSYLCINNCLRGLTCKMP